MRTKLIQLYETLEDTVPKYVMKSSRYVKADSEMSQECDDLYEHILKMRSLTVKNNNKGIDVIADTDIRVLTSVAFGNYIDSRYGKLVIPIPVSFL